MSTITFISPAAALGLSNPDFCLAVRQGVSDALQNMTSQEIQIAFSGNEDSAAPLAQAA